MTVLVFFVGFTLPGAVAVAADRPIVAVFDIEDRSKSLTPEQLTNLTDYLASLLVEGGYNVVSRDQIRERLLAEKKESYKQCYEQSCQIELGRELAAQKVLSTRILPIAGKCQVTVSLYDLKRAAAEMAANSEAECNELSLVEAFKIVAAKLCAPLGGKPEKPAPEEPGPDSKARLLEEEIRARAEAEVRIRMETEARIRAEQDARARAEEEERKRQEEARRLAQLEADRRQAEADALAAEERRQREEEERRRTLARNRRIATRPLMLDNMIPGNLGDLLAYLSWGSVPEGLHLANQDYISYGFLIQAALGDEANTFSVGLALGLYFVDIDTTDTSPIGFGNPALTFKYRKCFDVDWTLCLGTSALLSFGVIDGDDLSSSVDSSSDPPLQDADLDHMRAESVGAAFRAAAVGVQDPTTARYEHMVFRPLAILTISDGDFFAQANAGFDLYTPLMNIDQWKNAYDTQVGFALHYGVATGYRITEGFLPIAEFNGWTSLVGSNTETALFVNVGPTLQEGSEISLFLFLSIPVTDAARYGGDIQLQFRMAGDF